MTNKQTNKHRDQIPNFQQTVVNSIGQSRAPYNYKIVVNAMGQCNPLNYAIAVNKIRQGIAPFSMIFYDNVVYAIEQCTSLYYETIVNNHTMGQDSFVYYEIVVNSMAQGQLLILCSCS